MRDSNAPRVFSPSPVHALHFILSPLPDISLTRSRDHLHHRHVCIQVHTRQCTENTEKPLLPSSSSWSGSVPLALGPRFPFLSSAGPSPADARDVCARDSLRNVRSRTKRRERRGGKKKAAHLPLSLPLFLCLSPPSLFLSPGISVSVAISRPEISVGGAYSCTQRLTSSY